MNSNIIAITANKTTTSPSANPEDARSGDLNDLLQRRYLRLPEVLRIVPVSRSTWLAKVRAGEYPRAYKLGPGMTAWRYQDIAALLDRFDKEQPMREAA